MTTIHFWSIVSSPNFHSLRILLKCAFWYINVPDLATNYERLSVLIAFLRIIIHYYMFETVYLHQTFTYYIHLNIRQYNSIPYVYIYVVQIRTVEMILDWKILDLEVILNLEWNYYHFYGIHISHILILWVVLLFI